LVIDYHQKLLEYVFSFINGWYNAIYKESIKELESALYIAKVADDDIMEHFRDFWRLAQVFLGSIDPRLISLSINTLRYKKYL